MDQIDYIDFLNYERIEMQRKTIVIKLIIFTNHVNFARKIIVTEFA